MAASNASLRCGMTPPVAGECVVTTSRSHMCSYCGDSGVYGVPPPAPVAGERCEMCAIGGPCLVHTPPAPVARKEGNPHEHYMVAQVWQCEDCGMVDGETTPPAPGARKDGCGCQVSPSDAFYPEIDSSACKYADLLEDVRRCDAARLAPPAAVPHKCSNFPMVGICNAHEKEWGGVMRESTAAVPRDSMRFHRGASVPNPWSWKECGADDDSCNYGEHLEFVPASAVADAVRAALMYAVHGAQCEIRTNVCTCGLSDLRARSRDGG